MVTSGVDVFGELGLLRSDFGVTVCVHRLGARGDVVG